MSNIAKVLKTIKDKEIKFVDLRFTDTKGKWQDTAGKLQLQLMKKLSRTELCLTDHQLAGWKILMNQI